MEIEIYKRLLEDINTTFSLLDSFSDRIDSDGPLYPLLFNTIFSEIRNISRVTTSNIEILEPLEPFEEKS